jgi:hypothetical protein
LSKEFFRIVGIRCELNPKTCQKSGNACVQEDA